MIVVVVVAARVPTGIDFSGSFKSPDLFDPAMIPVHAGKNIAISMKNELSLLYPLPKLLEKLPQLNPDIPSMRALCLNPATKRPTNIEIIDIITKNRKRIPVLDTYLSPKKLMTKRKHRRASERTLIDNHGGPSVKLAAIYNASIDPSIYIDEDTVVAR